MEIEGDFTKCPGIGMEELDDGTRHMTQKCSIKKMIENTKMTGSNPNKTPATQIPLGSDANGADCDDVEWNCASMVGMSLCVSNNTRPDITHAVSQVAHFTAKPKMSHVKAIKTIVCYLKKDADKGIIVKPDGTCNVKCWVNADFAGNFGSKPNNNPKSCKSRHGCVITHGGTPLIWKSQLIKEICLGTLHAECVGLSQALQAMIPI